jgi:hypothetical protein
MRILWFVLIVPGLVCLYALVIRAALQKVPALKKFYSEADTFWAKVWAICGKSITVAWGYVLGGVGAALAMIEPLAATLGDPNIKDQVTSALASNPKVIGWITIGISLITIAARMRSIMKGV